MLHSTKDLCAQIFITLWIIVCILLGLFIIKSSFLFDLNIFLGIPEYAGFSEEVQKEAQIVIFMISMGLFGGISFIIRDFYQSIKKANLYHQAFNDYSEKNIGFEAFQKLTPIDVYTGRFNHTWTFWFTIQPFLSMVLGMISFFIARSGLGIVSGISPDLTIQALYMYAVITFLAGFSSHKFLAWLDRFADNLFGHSKPAIKKQKLGQGVQASAKNEREVLKEHIG